MTEWSEEIDPMIWIDKEGTSNYGSRRRRTKVFTLFFCFVKPKNEERNSRGLPHFQVKTR
jgi:hypothetical protein